jgi:hypothetical protein
MTTLKQTILEDFDMESIEKLWKSHGFSIKMAEECRRDYEEISGEDISFDDVNQAIMESNESGGMFPERLENFFLGWRIAYSKSP